MGDRKLTVVLYSRKDCHLCDDVLKELENLQAEIPHELVVIDIDAEPKLKKEYELVIPVVAVGPFKLKSPFSTSELRVTLAAARDRERHIEMVEASPKLQQVRQQVTWNSSDSFSYWFYKHYMSIFNFFVVLYLGGAFLAPVMMKAGWETPANWVYKGYSLVCHQLGFRSFFLFGDQLVYPRAEASVAGLATFNQATGLSEGSQASDLFKARSFVGNEQIGFKIALCQRDVMIYFGILLFGLLFSISGYRVPALPWYIWIVIGCIPIAVDGFSQILSQPPLSFLPFRESSPYLRSLTGFLFGFTTAWFGYPVAEESMGESRKLYQERLKRFRQRS